ncbi:MAG TPA: hypothetical protein VMX13_10170 [Sedimentisphaerales bacterium]|nr:hypothetical protein [Sedimentisphaerales bacterium]
MENKEAKATKPKRGLRWWVLVFLGTALVILVFLWISRRAGTPSIEQQLAAIEAARAIPDEENAAVIYNELLETVYVYSTQPAFVVMTDPAAISGPWLSKDHPETAAWLRGHESTILKLKEAVAKRECRLPIGLDPVILSRHNNLAKTMRQWTYLLVAAGNNDIAEGRIDTGVEKYLSVLQMAEHVGQQPMVIDLLVSIALEAVASKNVSTFIVEGDCTKEHLDTIEEALPPTSDDWLKNPSKAIELEMLLAKKKGNILGWWILRLQDPQRAALERCEELCRRTLASRRGAYILLALRRYKNTNGSWPHSLDEVKSLAPPEVFVDPLNAGSFVYKLTQDTFTLYSRGQNNIDENGNHTGGADDWLIWPPSSRRTQTPQPPQ